MPLYETPPITPPITPVFVGGPSSFVGANPQSIPPNFATVFTFANPAIVWNDDGVFVAASHGFVIPASWNGKRILMTGYVTFDSSQTGTTNPIILEILRGNLDTIDWPSEVYKSLTNVTFELMTIQEPMIVTAGEVIGMRVSHGGAGNALFTPRMMIQRLN